MFGPDAECSMLHHCQVDRLWTYWQFMKPTETTFKTSYEGSSRFATIDGAIIRPDSPLRPFFSAPGKFHTPKSVDSIKGFGYSYEGLEYWRKTTTQLKADATALINRKYGPAQSRLLAVDAQPRVHYFVRAQVELAEVDRPCSFNFYVNGTQVGSLSLLMQPPSGPFNGKFALEETAKTSDKDSTLDKVLEGIELRIIKVRPPNRVTNSTNRIQPPERRVSNTSIFGAEPQVAYRRCRASSPRGHYQASEVQGQQSDACSQGVEEHSWNSSVYCFCRRRRLTCRRISRRARGVCCAKIPIRIAN